MYFVVTPFGYASSNTTYSNIWHFNKHLADNPIITEYIVCKIAKHGIEKCNNWSQIQLTLALYIAQINIKH